MVPKKRVTVPRASWLNHAACRAQPGPPMGLHDGALPEASSE